MYRSSASGGCQLRTIASSLQTRQAAAETVCVAAKGSHAPTLYDVLGVAPTAPTTDIRAAYRARIFVVHPDRNSSPEAADLARALNEAWRVLGDAALRRRYDADLSVSSSQYTDAPSSHRARADSSPRATPAPESPYRTCDTCGRRLLRDNDLCDCADRQSTAARVLRMPDRVRVSPYPQFSAAVAIADPHG